MKLPKRLTNKQFAIMDRIARGKRLMFAEGERYPWFWDGAYAEDGRVAEALAHRGTPLITRPASLLEPTSLTEAGRLALAAAKEGTS